mmetsp:Transcript_19572/g.50549  ORF Transcript_19572/g.50549 Transcript_19572/m.50549 type:complete len:438 (-) Transcript_19572:111-1424(-)|eukprot:CAMPEP_0119424062 /NCGR_PEP_ID=MMETSP1335-20130426/31739_1 /TAXON_ID=259385 /ORGANISM="Chrysoculter rhomboideus, Strain RCC1486" /LENGTH=437 /DNA_ID=CAMNT_0007449575 /DNA_START=8 /DNA_END=1321 /DNA_ORIENTATION=+
MSATIAELASPANVALVVDQLLDDTADILRSSNAEVSPCAGDATTDNGHTAKPLDNTLEKGRGSPLIDPPDGDDDPLIHERLRRPRAGRHTWHSYGPPRTPSRSLAAATLDVPHQGTEEAPAHSRRKPREMTPSPKVRDRFAKSPQKGGIRPRAATMSNGEIYAAREAAHAHRATPSPPPRPRPAHPRMPTSASAGCLQRAGSGAPVSPSHLGPVRAGRALCAASGWSVAAQEAVGDVRAPPRVSASLSPLPRKPRASAPLRPIGGSATSAAPPLPDVHGPVLGTRTARHSLPESLARLSCAAEGLAEPSPCAHAAGPQTRADRTAVPPAATTPSAPLPEPTPEARAYAMFGQADAPREHELAPPQLPPPARLRPLRSGNSSRLVCGSTVGASMTGAGAGGGVPPSSMRTASVGAAAGGLAAGSHITHMRLPTHHHA